MSMQLFESALQELKDSAQQTLSVAEHTAFAPIIDALAGGMPPASSSKGRHGGFEGGLVCHTRDVWRLASAMAGSAAIVLGERIPFAQENPEIYDLEAMKAQFLSLAPGPVLKVALLHDLSKVRTIDGKSYYVPNVLAKGARSEQKPWKVNEGADPALSLASILGGAGFDGHPVMTLFSPPTSLQIREGQISLAVAQALSPSIMTVLSHEERAAVIYHDGLFPSARDGVSDKANCCSLQMILHSADMMASRFMC